MTYILSELVNWPLISLYFDSWHNARN